MPSDIAGQRHPSLFHKSYSPSSFFSEEFRLSSERQAGVCRSGSVPDHCGLEAMSLMSGRKAVSSSHLEKLCAGENYVDCSEFPQSYLLKEPKTNINFEHSLMGIECSASQSMATWRAPCQDLKSPSKFYMQPASLSVQANDTAGFYGIHHENGLISNSLTGAFEEKLRLSSNAVLFGQSVDTTKPNYGDDEPLESLEQIEAQTIGNLLPDDDDLLAGAIHDFACVTRPNREDSEDDLFYSGGGMELEADDTFSYEKASEFMNWGAYGGQNGELDNQFTVRFPSVEYPTRTLLVRNININVEDVDLRALFEQYGEIEALYTAGQNRGIVMISYYDLRAAQNAAGALQNKPFRSHKLDIHFFSLKDCPSKKDINQGMIVVFNLASSITNDDIHQIFGIYGQIKEIHETSNKHYQKIIEFYDVRAAEAALCADRRDIAGKRIKIELLQSSHSKCSGQQLNTKLNEAESGECRQGGCYYKSPSEWFVSSGLMTHGTNTSNVLHSGSSQGIHSAVQMPKSSFMETKLLGISSGVPHNLSSTGRVATVGNHSKPSCHCQLSHSVNLGLHSMPTFQPHSLPEFHDGVISAIPFNAVNTISAMDMSISSALADGTDMRSTQGVASGGVSRHFLERNEASFGSSGNGSCPLHSHQYGWNNSNTYHHHTPSSMLWQNLSPFMNAQPPQQVHGLSTGLPHMSNPAAPLHHHHAGSAPAVNTSIWDRRHTYGGDCMEAASRHPGSLGSAGFSSCSPLHSLEFTSHNIFSHANGNGIDSSYPSPHSGIPSPHSGIPSPHSGIPSPQRRGQVFRGRSTVTSPTAYDGPSDRIRSRRGDANSNQGDNKKQYELDIDRILRGEDSRTTLMIKNIPNKYTSKMLLATIDEQHKGTYDFIYLPIDFKNKCNVGYAFINMIDPQHIIPFYEAFNGKKWEKFNSEKVASLAYARIQGKAALIAHFQNSSLMNEDKRCRPIIFHSDGPKAGDQEAFPVGVNIRSRRFRTAMENHRGSPSGSSNGEESPSSGSEKDE